MGVGTPVNLLESIGLGVDMFDCVIPTRNGRNGMIFTSNGIINIKNKKWENDFSPIDRDGKSYLSRHYSKAYLRHLMLSQEILGAQIASISNLAFYLDLIKEARKQIIDGKYGTWKDKKIRQIQEKL